MQGNNGDDRIKGGDGNDLLLGSAGDDILIGGPGFDTLLGEKGADRFDFNKPSDSPVDDAHDLVSGFKRAQHDQIDLATIDADSHAPGNQQFTFIGAASFKHYHQLHPMTACSASRKVCCKAISMATGSPISRSRCRAPHRRPPIWCCSPGGVGPA